MSARARAVLHGPMAEAYSLLPARMNTTRASVQVLAMGLQESRLLERRQRGNGPARGLWQFELAGGVAGVLSHHATAEHALALCKARGVAPTPRAVWARLAVDDVLAAGFARLLLASLPAPLAPVGDAWEAWEQYIAAWRPGQPHQDTWLALYQEAVETVAAND